MIVLAYDGSLNGDWVSRYAIRIATAEPEPCVRLVHVRERALSEEQLEAKLARVESECRSAGVVLVRDVRSPAGSVYDGLVAGLPQAGQDLVVCGTRVRARAQGMLRGTLAERLLRQRLIRVMAVRVVQPGLLGSPHRFLVPLSGNPRNLAGAWPFLRLFLPHAHEVRVLRVMMVSGARLAAVSAQRMQALREEGWRTVDRALAQIQDHPGPAAPHLDGRVLISDDWANEVLVQANTLKAQLIVMGASDRTLPGRIAQGSPLEQLLREAPCDVAVCRS